MADHGAFYWNELRTRDVAAAKAFYAAVVGWQAEDVPMPGGEGNYTLFKNAQGAVGGMVDVTAMMPAETPAHWAAFVAVDDVDAAVARTERAGGTVLMPALDVPDVGRISIVRDPTGAAIGIMTPVASA
jgi:predicted enzyme related to lactoylglutathione lyase